MPAQPKKEFYRPELDILRLLAFLLVFFSHVQTTFKSWFMLQLGSASGSGLQLFFVLSAYLITELLLREREKTGTIHIRAFFVRRILRIWPLYFFFLAVTYLLARHGHGIFPTRALVAFLLLAGNWWIYFHGFLSFIIGPLWSISVEEQFYLIWPFLMFFGGRRALQVATPVILAVAAAALWYSGLHGQTFAKYWSNSLVEFQFFAVGGLLALLLHGRRIQLNAITRVLLFAGWAAAYLLLSFRREIYQAHAETGALFATFALLIAGSVCLFLGMYGLSVPALARPLVYLGRISYGLYVYHLTALYLLESAFRHHHPQVAFWPQIQIALALALCIAMASASFYLLEKPFLRLKSRFTFVHSRDA